MKEWRNWGLRGESFSRFKSAEAEAEPSQVESIELSQRQSFVLEFEQNLDLGEDIKHQIGTGANNLIIYM